MNKKRKTVIIIALMCLFALSLVLASCQNHTHNFAVKWSSDESKHWKICAQTGCNKVYGYGSHDFDNVWYSDQKNHWQQCSMCSREANKEKHTVSDGSWSTVRYPTVTQEGLKTGRCSVCNAVVTEEIPRLEHEHSFGDSYMSNDGWHWLQCSCGEMESFAAHQVTIWTTDIEATETTAGQKSGQCDICHKKLTETIPIKGHEHYFGDNYASDEVGHWKECSCGEKETFAAHQVTNWTTDLEPTETDEGRKSGQCDVCHRTITETIPVKGHEHVFSTELRYNDTYHYYECECGAQSNLAKHEYAGEWQIGINNHWQECECGREGNIGTHTASDWIIDSNPTTTSTGSKHTECTVCHTVLSTQTINKLTSTIRTVDFYAINDFHGTVDRISSVGGYLKQQKNNNANTVLLNSGDMFQGSMESNSNYGTLLNNCMKTIGFDAFTFGNHEFDWGLNKLGQLANNGSVPFLGANIYHWDASTKRWGTFASELAQEYVIKELDNGLKIGIIGIIGEDQITSISSNLVQTIGFKDPLPIIKTLATKLRNDESCDVVVVSAHVGPQGLVGETENNQCPSSTAELENYVDAVFCAHTHWRQTYVVNGLPFIQGGSNGNYVSHIKLSVSSDGSVTCDTQENLSYSNYWSKLSDVDNLVNNANEQIKDERNQVLATLGGSMSKNPDIPRLVSRAIAEYAKNQGYNIALAMVNTARSNLSSGQLTYSDLYEAIPFDNEVYIAKVKGSEIINETNYGVYYWRSTGEAIQSDEYYYIAIIDYLLFHQSASRSYNYFRSAFTSGFTPVALSNNKYEAYNYRLITRDYLLANTISVSDYTVDNTNTDTSLLQSAVTLKYQTTGNWNVSSSGKTTLNNSNTTPATNHTGTLSDPYDIADALLLGAKYTDGSQAPKLYVKGVVSNASRISQRGWSGDVGGFCLEDENGNIITVYYISKNQAANAGTGDNWASMDEIKDGDVLVVYAAVYFSNGTTPQVGYGYCISINGEPT